MFVMLPDGYKITRALKIRWPLCWKTPMPKFLGEEKFDEQRSIILPNEIDERDLMRV
jgi:hypothetical protein